MANPEPRGLRHTRYFDFDAAKLRERCALRRIIRQQILRAQFVADPTKRLVELLRRSRIVVLPAGIFRKLNQGVLAPVSRPALASIGTIMIE